nr:PREDICTED: coiled-coil domain-containing protein 1 [Anolis carolinensis]|eukprot:XP_016850026.1 PREDICTED: coiled-coil domain-containing protein 1 [Anolis carolinensis]
MAQGPNGDAGEDKSLSPNGETESIRSRSSSIRIEVSKPEEEHEQVKEVSSKIQDLNEQLEESIPEEINVQVEESILHEFNEQDKDDIPQDLKEVPEEHIKTPEEQLPGKISTQPSFSNSDNITVTEWQKDLINSPFPEAKVDGLLSRTPSKKIEETEPQDLKEKTEEQMENLTDIYADKFESRSSLYLPVQSRKKKRR